MARKIITDELKEQIIDFYLSKPMSLEEVSINFNLCLPTILKILKDVPKYTKVEIYNPNIKEDFFENIDSDEKAYFLGLLISDGNVFIPKDNRSPSISLTLHLQDEYMLENFNKYLGLNHRIGYDGRGCGQVAIRSKKMAIDLTKYGIAPNKTLHTFLPSIDSQFLPGLIRGIIDGDGSIQYHDKRSKHYHNISICGTHLLMEAISETLFSILNLNHKPSVYDYKDRNLSEIKIQNIEDIIKIGNWIYKDSSLYLIRKYNKFKQLIEYYNTTHVNTEITE